MRGGGHVVDYGCTMSKNDFPLSINMLEHRINMKLDLQSLIGLLCTDETPHLPPPPAFGLIYEGAIGQHDISL